MRLSWNGTYPVTTEFGVKDPAYANYPGSRHPGVDHAVPANTQFYAGMSGFVTTYDRQASMKTGRGKEVVITNGDIERIECHMNRIDVKNGQWVKEGDPIGLSGNTGYVRPEPTPAKPNNGAHAHSEMKIKGVRVDVTKHLTNSEDEMETIKILESALNKARKDSQTFESALNAERRKNAELTKTLEDIAVKIKALLGKESV